jgi:hypothetical protein
MHRIAPRLVVLGVLALTACADRHPHREPSCSGTTDVELTLAQSTDPGEPLVPFNKAELVADRTITFTYWCDVRTGGTEKTQCTESQAPRRHILTYSDGSPFSKVTLRLYDRFGALSFEKLGYASSEEQLGDDCRKYSHAFWVRYAFDPPGVSDAGETGDAGDSGGDDVSAD